MQIERASGREFESRNSSVQLVGISALHHFKVWAQLRTLVRMNGIVPFVCLSLKSLLTGPDLANGHRGPGCELADLLGIPTFLENPVGKFVPGLECRSKGRRVGSLKAGIAAYNSSE